MATNWEWRAGLLQPRQESSPSAVERLPPVAAPVDPIAPRDDLSLDYYDPFTRQLAFGNAGFQSYRLGWYFYEDVTWAPTSPVRGVSGSFQDLQYNSWVRYSRVQADRYLFSWTGAWNSSFWTGPSGVNLPPDADQLISDFQIASLNPGRWNWQVGVTPQVNADFRRSLNSNSFLVDGRFVLFYQASSQLRWAAGAAYWNRVRNIFIPYGGLIWSPDDRWEFRLFFPETRISRYWGTFGGKHLWTYASVGYHVDAWQVSIQNASQDKTRMQMSDIQALLGVSTQSGKWTAFAEAGLIFDRHVLFRGSTPSFGIHDNLLLRIGALY
jgi:hypothetical protein